MLHLAARAGNSKLTAWLIEHGAVVDVRSNNFTDCVTPLMLATRKGHVEVMEVLLGAGLADIDLADRKGRTPLMYAAQFNQPDAALFLLRVGADKSLRDMSGVLAAVLATGGGHHELAQIIMSFAAEPFRGARVLAFVAEQQAQQDLKKERNAAAQESLGGVNLWMGDLASTISHYMSFVGMGTSREKQKQIELEKHARRVLLQMEREGENMLGKDEKDEQ
jgi:hypothetical protein